MSPERYETMKKNAHTLYLRGDLPQSLAVSAMGYKPSNRWVITQLHRLIAWCFEKMVAK